MDSIPVTFPIPRALPSTLIPLWWDLSHSDGFDLSQPFKLYQGDNNLFGKIFEDLRGIKR